jgi:hypothetical protein
MVSQVKLPSGQTAPLPGREPQQESKIKHFSELTKIFGMGRKLDPGSGEGEIPVQGPVIVLPDSDGGPPQSPEARRGQPLMDGGVGKECISTPDEREAEPTLDPMEIVLASPPTSPSPTHLTPRIDFVAAVEELVRRVSWGGDRRSGAARIELGGGALAGGSILVQTRGRQVQVEVELPPGADGRELEARLSQRLAARGLEVVVITMR